MLKLEDQAIVYMFWKVFEGKTRKLNQLHEVKLIMVKFHQTLLKI